MRAYAPAVAPSFGFNRTGVPVFAAVAATARRLWPVKTAVNLASRAGTTHRAAEKWLAGETGLSGDALAELLRSDAGLAMLEAIMGEAKPAWWLDFKINHRLHDLVRRQTENSQEIEELRRAMAERSDR